MTITILTLFPGLFAGFLEQASTSPAQSRRGLMTAKPVDIRDYASGPPPGR